MRSIIGPTLSPLLIAVVFAGCERAADPLPTPEDAAEEAAESPGRGRGWRAVREEVLVAAPRAEADEAMTAAIAEARSTADDARARWTDASATEQDRWAIKWAAPTVDGGVEYLWVQPVHWSRFRIEGHLLNEPTEELVGDPQPDAMVSFPIEELADWIRFASLNPDRPLPPGRPPFEGGYTVRVLVERFGAPPPRK